MFIFCELVFVNLFHSRMQHNLFSWEMKVRSALPHCPIHLTRCKSVKMVTDSWKHRIITVCPQFVVHRNHPSWQRVIIDPFMVHCWKLFILLYCLWAQTLHKPRLAEWPDSCSQTPLCPAWVGCDLVSLYWSHLCLRWFGRPSRAKHNFLLSKPPCYL